MSIKKEYTRRRRGCQGVVIAGRVSAPVTRTGTMKRGTNKKRCPRCGGNMFFQRDDGTGFRNESYQWYGWCLQCGCTLYLKPGAVPDGTEKEEVRV